jgi:uncharacterized membrane protein YfcA
MLFTGIASLIGVLAAAVASVVGFGIGSVLTPLLAVKLGTKLAVAAAAIPHFFASLQRFWILRGYVDRRILFGFGVASAAGGSSQAFSRSGAAFPPTSR